MGKNKVHLDYQPGLIFEYMSGTYVVTKLNNDYTYDYYYNSDKVFKSNGISSFDEKDKLLSSIFVGEL